MYYVVKKCLQKKTVSNLGSKPALYDLGSATVQASLLEGLPSGHEWTRFLRTC